MDGKFNLALKSTPQECLDQCQNLENKICCPLSSNLKRSFGLDLIFLLNQFSYYIDLDPGFSYFGKTNIKKYRKMFDQLQLLK